MGTKIFMTHNSDSVTDSFTTNTLVIGGGIIGVGVASQLRDRDVTILDSGSLRYGTSIGNAGHVVVATPNHLPHRE